MKNLNSYMANRYRIGGQSLIHWREKIILARLLEKAGGIFDNLLDCPCGYGRFTKDLSKRTDFLVSSDLSSSRMVAHNFFFNDKTGGYLGNRCNITQLPFKDKAVDGIITFRLFHHLVDEDVRKKVFQEAERVSKHFFLISYYNANPLHQLSRKLHRDTSIRNGKKAFLPAYKILDEAKDAGWHLVESHKVLPMFHAQTVALFVKA